MAYTYLATARLNARPKLPPEPSKQHHNLFSEEAFAKAMAQAARAENEAMRRVMGGSELRGHVLGSSMQERVDDFADACGTEGKTVPEVARILGLPMSTVQTHCHRAVLSGAVRKVQHSRRERAMFFDARGEEV